MIFSKFFNKSSNLDKELDRNLLFAPNYLIREQKVNNNTQYIFGGHSIITIEQTQGKNVGLFFNRTRTSKSNKLNLNPKNELHLGFQTIAEVNYLILGTRQHLSHVKPGDLLEICFNDDSKINLTLESTDEKATVNKGYACNVRAKINDKELKHFQKKMMNIYKLTLNASGETVEGAFDKEFCQKFREVAQSYVFCLENYY